MRIHFNYILLLTFLISFRPQPAMGQQLRNPLDFPILLSGNFGELRSNHFHAGIDFKTQGAEGKPVHAVEKGYVSRISVSPGGYGNGLYITHPDGTTTVYGHLQRFNDKIATYVKTQQYAQESFSVNLILTPGDIPVEKGEVVALSGNTGSSGGPHLHFEVRDTETEDILDPLSYYLTAIKDNRAPVVQGVMLYPVEGEGVVGGSNRKKEIKPATIQSKGIQSLPHKVEAWGKIGIAVKSYDYMDNTSNIYGVKEITLTADSQVIFHSNLERLSFDESRYINSFIDYEEWIDHRSYYMKSFVEPGNRLSFLESQNRGFLTINEERTYYLVYRLTDAFGNTSRLTFQIEGKKQPIPARDTINTEPFHWGSINRFGAKGVRLTIPKGNLYTNLLFRHTVKEDSMALAGIHQIHDKPVAFHHEAQLSLRLQHDTLANKQQYGVVRIRKGQTTWLGGNYRDGWIDANIRETGQYTLAQDTAPPTITPLNQANWSRENRFTFRLSDNLSGVHTYRGEIDGQYVLFEMNNRSVITYRFDNERLARGPHTLTLTVTDGCGNQTAYRHDFSR